MNVKKRKVICDGELDLAGYKIPCYVLEDGTRVLSTMGVQLALKMVDEEDPQKSGTRLGRYLSKKAFEPLISTDENYGQLEPIVCYKGKKKINGFEATVLVDVANIFLEARKQGKLSTDREKLIAEQSETLVRVFAKVGIIALVDEATGYQYERERFELQKIFKLLILEDGIFSEVKKMFPLDYYKELFEVYDVSFTAENIRRKPRFIGWLTNELVYKNLPKGSFILEKIKERTPKTKGGHYKVRFYRSLTPAGSKALTERINTVKTLAWVAKKDKNKRNKLHKLVKEKFHPNRDLPYVDIEAMDDQRLETEFDKALEALTKVPPIRKKEQNK